MELSLEFIGRGAKWSIVVFQLACLLNPYLVTGVDDSLDIIPSESRSPYYYLSQREFVVNPKSGQYEEVTNYTTTAATTTSITTTPYPSPSSSPGSLQKRSGYHSRDQDESGSITSQRFENAYTRYNFANNEGEVSGDGGSNSRQDSIQDVLNHRQGQYSTSTPASTYGGASDATGTNPGGSPSYDSVTFQSPLVSYEVPSNYFPSENFDWPSTYTSTGPYGPPLHGGGPVGLVAPFLSGVGHLTSSVKHVQAQLGEQKAKTAYQVADVVKNTGHAVNHAILNKGHVAGQVVGHLIQTTGDAVASKGYTAQKIIANKGHLATSAIQSVGNIGTSLLRSKGELVGAVLKTGAALGTSSLGTASNALAGATYLVKAKGDAASNLIAKGGKLASGVIGTKGRVISSVINAKGHFVAQIVEAKGRAAASLLETSGQKLTQLAEAIKSVTQQKHPQPGPGWNAWGSAPDPQYSAPVEQEKQAILQKEEPQPIHANHQHAHQFQQDYRDSYYDPRDPPYSNQDLQLDSPTVDDYGRKTNSKRNTATGQTRNVEASREEQQPQQQQQQQQQQQDDEQEDFQNEYSSYYQPHHYSSSSGPSEYQQYSQYQYD